MPQANKRQTIGKVEAIEGTGSPNQVPGVIAEIASQFQDTASGDQWLKIGNLDTDWIRLEKADEEDEIFARENVSPNNLDASDTNRYILIDLNTVSNPLTPTPILNVNAQYIIKSMITVKQTGVLTEGAVDDQAYMFQTTLASMDGAGNWTKHYEQYDLTHFTNFPGTNDAQMNTTIDLSQSQNILLSVSNGADIGAGSSGREMFWHGRLEVFFVRSFA